MRPLAGRRVCALLRTVLVTGLIAGAVLVSPSAADATTAVTLYVSPSGTKMSGCTGTSATACKTIQEGVTAAEVYTGGSVTITVAAGTYAGGIEITATNLTSLTIAGAGPSTTKVTGGGSTRDFLAGFGTITITDLSIDNGRASSGGGVAHTRGDVDIGTLILSDDILSNDQATTAGGAVSNDSFATVGGVNYYSAVTLTDDTFSDDTGRLGGGAVANRGIATVTGDTFSHDAAYTGSGGAASGGGITNSGIATVDNDTFAGDTATEFGGGISNSGIATMDNDTFVGDTATEDGGGVFSSTGGSATSARANLFGDTFLDDASSYGGGAFGGIATVTGSIFDASSCRSTGSSGMYNVVTTSTCGTWGAEVTPSALDLTTTLKSNTSTGPETLAIGPTSPALNKVPKTVCTVRTDERGDPRPGITGQTNCDAGAYELQHSPGTLIQGTPKSGSVAHGGASSWQLAVTTTLATTGKVTFSATSGSVPTGVTVSATGEVSVAATTKSGSYTLTGVDTDPLHDTGSWTFGLDVTGASSTVTLYVSKSGTKTTGCTGPETTACKTVQEGVTAASTYTGGTITINVAAGKYAGGIKIASANLSSLIIRGASASTTRVTGEGKRRDFAVETGTVTISDLSIDGGHASTGGGVLNRGTVTLTEDSVSTDSATTNGGGVLNLANLTAAGDTFSNDSSALWGGGIANKGSGATVTDDTFSRDSATGYGGGFYNVYARTSVLTEDTFSHDSSDNGGGIWNSNRASIIVTGSVFETSTCTDWSFPTSPALVSGSYNVVAVTATRTTSTRTCRQYLTNTVTTTDEGLDLSTMLRSNASTGPETVALGPTSVAIDEVPKTACSVKADERGDPRPGIKGQTRCDAGAYELQHTPVPLLQKEPKTGYVAYGMAGTFHLAVKGSPTKTGKVIFRTSGGAPAGVAVEPTGKLSVSASTAQGVYTLTGTDADPLEDAGTWSFTLHIGQAPGSPRQRRRRFT